MAAWIWSIFPTAKKYLCISEELGIAKELIANYMAAKPTIDACNRRFDGDSKLAQDDFNSDDEDWAIE